MRRLRQFETKTLPPNHRRLRSPFSSLLVAVIPFPSFSRCSRGGGWCEGRRFTIRTTTTPVLPMDAPVVHGGGLISCCASFSSFDCWLLFASGGRCSMVVCKLLLPIDGGDGSGSLIGLASSSVRFDVRFLYLWAVILTVVLEREKAM